MIEPDSEPDGSASPRRSRADVGWLAAIGLLALALRLAYVLDFSSHPLGRMAWVDEGAYWSKAGEIAAGRLLPDRPFYQDPLFPYLLAALRKSADPPVSTARVILACLGALTPLIVYLTGREGLGRAEGAVAGLIAAAYGPSTFADGLIEKEGTAALVASIALALTVWAGSKGPGGVRIGRVGLAGLAWGVLALLRSNALAVAPVGAIWAATLARGPRRRAGVALAFLGGFFLALLPSTAVNLYVGRPPEWIPTTYQLGANFYVGNGPGATGTYWAPEFVEANPAREADDFEAEARRRSGRALSPAGVSRFWLGEGLRRWREEPGASIRLLGAKLALLLNQFEIPDNQDPEFVRAVASPRLALAFLDFGWLAPLAALGLFRSPRSPSWRMIAASTVVGLASTAIFFVVGRYRIPWAPGMALLAGAGAVDLARRARSREWRGVAWRVGLVAVPVGFLAWRPIADPAPDRWGHAEIMLAAAWLGEGDLDPAIDALDDARALGPGPARRVAEIGQAGPIFDRIAALVRERRDRAGGEGNVPEVRQARWLRQVPQGRAVARRLLDSILARTPDDPEALRESAAWRLGDPDDPAGRPKAVEELRRACRDPGGEPSASILLALLSKDPAALPPIGPPAGTPGRLALARAILQGSGTRVSKD